MHSQGAQPPSSFALATKIVTSSNMRTTMRPALNENRLRASNDYLCASDFTLGEKLIIPQYCRIFANSFEQGGRFYDGSYQNLKKSIRSTDQDRRHDTQGRTSVDFLPGWSIGSATFLISQAAMTLTTSSARPRRWTEYRVNAGTRRSGTGAIARYLEPPVEEGGAAMGAKVRGVL